MKRLAIAAAMVLGAMLRLAPAAPSPIGQETDLERGTALFQAGDFAAAIAPLAAAHAADASDLDAALLLGIAYYRVHDIARAEPLLVAAARSKDAETRDSAQIFLGLIADASGDATRAHRYYDLVARSTTDLAQSAQQLIDRGQGERFAAVAVVRPEIDSNVPLLPGTAAPGDSGATDTDLVALVDARVRPFTATALVIEEALAYRKQARLTDYDMASSVSSATWSYRGAAARAALGYHFDISTLGGTRYQVGHTAEVSGRRAIAGSLGIGASYQFVARTLDPAAYAGYSGIVHTATARLVWTTPDSELELGYMFAREQTDDATLSAIANGAQLVARLGLARGTDLRVFTQVADRGYDAASLGRHDVQVRVEASLYLDLSSHLGAVLGGSLLDNTSNTMDQSYTKWTAFVGAVVATSP